jgi:hypothetical protein
VECSRNREFVSVYLLMKTVKQRAIQSLRWHNASEIGEKERANARIAEHWKREVRRSFGTQQNFRLRQVQAALDAERPKLLLTLSALPGGDFNMSRLRRLMEEPARHAEEIIRWQDYIEGLLPEPLSILEFSCYSRRETQASVTGELVIAVG